MQRKHICVHEIRISQYWRDKPKLWSLAGLVSVKLEQAVQKNGEISTRL